MGRKRKGDRLSPFVALTWDLLNCEAYISLPNAAAKALPYFLGKIKLNGSDPEKYKQKFSFSYSEGKRLGFAPATFSRVICKLVAFGFIDPVKKGGLRSDAKTYNFFKLSKRWEKFKTPDFKTIDWKTFVP